LRSHVTVEEKQGSRWRKRWAAAEEVVGRGGGGGAPVIRRRISKLKAEREVTHRGDALRRDKRGRERRAVPEP
jgi:hypothetical protein